MLYIALIALTFRDDMRAEPYRYELPYGGGGAGGGGGGGGSAPFAGAGPQAWHPDIPHLVPHHGGHPLQSR